MQASSFVRVSADCAVAKRSVNSFAIERLTSSVGRLSAFSVSCISSVRRLSLGVDL
jgi:hypothetical protein